MIKTLANYHEAVVAKCRKLDLLSATTHPWFRGHGNAAWTLTPGLYRPGVGSRYEREMTRDFYSRAMANEVGDPSRAIHALFVMQHHGLPTRLLDWTESSLVALFFAVETQDKTSDGAVWVINPWSVNNAAGIGCTVPTNHHPAYDDWCLCINTPGARVRAVNPAAVRPVHNAPRVTAQRGVFTIHGSSRRPIEQLPTVMLEKVVIDASAKSRLKKELTLSGITYATLFPDLDGLAKELRYRYTDEYLDQPC